MDPSRIWDKVQSRLDDALPDANDERQADALALSASDQEVEAQLAPAVPGWEELDRDSKLFWLSYGRYMLLSRIDSQTDPEAFAFFIQAGQDRLERPQTDPQFARESMHGGEQVKYSGSLGFIAAFREAVSSNVLWGEFHRSPGRLAGGSIWFPPEERSGDYYTLVRKFPPDENGYEYVAGHVFKSTSGICLPISETEVLGFEQDIKWGEEHIVSSNPSKASE